MGCGTGALAFPILVHGAINGSGCAQGDEDHVAQTDWTAEVLHVVDSGEDCGPKLIQGALWVEGWGGEEGRDWEGSVGRKVRGNFRR